MWHLTEKHEKEYKEAVRVSEKATRTQQWKVSEEGAECINCLGEFASAYKTYVCQQVYSGGR